MFRITTKMPVLYRRGLYCTLLVSLLTGITFFVMNRWVEVVGEFGPEKHAWQYPFLKAHGIAAFLMMMYFGSLLTTHVAVSWRFKPLSKFGLTLLIVVGFQVVSAWFLYYLSNEELRAWVVYFHLAVGCSIPCLLLVHIRLGISARRARTA